MKIAYLVKRILRRHVPSPVLFKVMEYSGRSNAAENAPDERFQALRDRLQELEVNLIGKHVLELGSGRYARLALRMLDAGARRVTLADFYATPLMNPQHRAVLERDCAQMGLDSGKALSNIELFVDDFLATSPAAGELAADLIVSTATLEHVRDPQAIFLKIWEWLRPGGFASHVIDLRDHLFADPFEMLTYSDRTWEKWLDPKNGFHLNRWRLPDYLRAMREASFVDIGYRTLQQSKAELLKIWPRLDERFRRMDVDLLSIMVVHLYGRKPTR